MKTIKLDNKDVAIATTYDDITISQFQQILTIYNTEYDFGIDRYIETIEVLSDLKREEIEQLDLDLFEEIIHSIEINEAFDFEKKFINEIEVDGVKFKTTSDGNSYKFNVKEMFMIQTLLTRKPDEYINDLAAIVFKEVDEDGKIINDYSIEAIEKRKEMLKDIKMITLGGYLMSLSEYFLNRKNVK